MFTNLLVLVSEPFPSTVYVVTSVSICTGICMEALCSPRSSEPVESVLTCLQALYTLLDSAWPRETLMGDKSLGIELCNVLHRWVIIFTATCILFSRRYTSLFHCTYCI